VKNKAKSMYVTFFDIKGNVHGEFVLASQTGISAYYCDVLRRLRENVRRLRPELWRQKNWLLHHDKAPSHTFFSPGNFFFTKNDMTISTHPRRARPDEIIELFLKLRNPSSRTRPWRLLSV
jgi:hypothetical protein